MKYLLERLKEVSTWQGILLLSAFAGLVIFPELKGRITDAAMIVTGLLSVIMKEHKPIVNKEIQTNEKI